MSHYEAFLPPCLIMIQVVGTYIAEGICTIMRRTNMVHIVGTSIAGDEVYQYEAYQYEALGWHRCCRSQDRTYQYEA